MNPSTEERDVLFKKFGRAFFKQDLDAMYEVVTEDFTYSILVNDEPRQMNTPISLINLVSGMLTTCSVI